MGMSCIPKGKRRLQTHFVIHQLVLSRAAAEPHLHAQRGLGTTPASQLVRNIKPPHCNMAHSGMACQVQDKKRPCMRLGGRVVWHCTQSRALGTRASAQEWGTGLSSIHGGRILRLWLGTRKHSVLQCKKTCNLTAGRRSDRQAMRAGAGILAGDKLPCRRAPKVSEAKLW